MLEGNCMEGKKKKKKKLASQVVVSRGQEVRAACGTRAARWLKNAAVEPSWALINNLLVHHSLSLKRRLQATEGCQQRRWRWADKTHSGGLLSASSLKMEAVPERERGRERMKQRENIKTFSPSIYKPFYCLNKLQVVFLHQDIRAPVHLAASHQNTELQSFSKKGTADESGSLFLPISS